jgi:hypothetical protein
MTIQFRSVLLCSAVLVLASMTPGAPAVTTGFCDPFAVTFAASNLLNSTTSSSSFVNIPETTVQFSQGGVEPSCVLVRFSASTYVDNGIDVIDIRAVLDNTTAALPGMIRVRGETDVVGYPRTFEFIFPLVSPGSHTLRMQYKSEKGNPVHVRQRNTVVQSNPNF